MEAKDIPAVDIQEAKKLIVSRAKARMRGADGVRQLLLFGHRGVGKSQIIEQVANSLNIPFKVVNLAVLEAPDFQGLPQIHNNRTVYARSSVLPDGDNGILLLDEINRPSLDIRQALLQFLTTREINGHKIGDGWLIVAAGNLSDESAQYSVDELDPALADRFAVYRLSPQLQTVVDYMKLLHNSDHLGVRWLQSDHSIVSTNGKGPSPRSFDAMCHAVTNCPDIDPFLVISGEMGRPAAAAFLGWYKSPASVAFVDIWNMTHHADEVLKELQSTQGGRIELLKVCIDGFAEKLATDSNYRVLNDEEINHVVWFMDRVTSPEWRMAFVAESWKFLGFKEANVLETNVAKIKAASPSSFAWASKARAQVSEHQEKPAKAEKTEDEVKVKKKK